MVTGAKELDRSDYNENSFEQKLYGYIGRDESQGIQYDLLSLSTALRFAEDKLILHSDEQWRIYKSSDEEEREKYKHFYAVFFATINPPLETLRASYFVSIHSIFEKAWKKVKYLCSHDLKEPFDNQFNRNYLQNIKIKPLAKTRKGAIEKVVLRYPKLFAYDSLRNNLFHGRGNKAHEKLGFDELVASIKVGELPDVQIEDDVFYLKSLKVMEEYSTMIINFLTDIERDVYEYRKEELL